MGYRKSPETQPAGRFLFERSAKSLFVDRAVADTWRWERWEGWSAKGLVKQIESARAY